MKKVWLFLALAAVAAATTETQVQTQAELKRRPCYGCYTPFGGLVPQDGVTLGEEFSIQMAVQDKQPRLPEERTGILEDPGAPASEPRKRAHILAARRSKREERRSGPVRRRGKQRSGSRAVCRGCYSGLMIVAPPVHTSNNTLGTLVGSHSESGADSSGEY